MKKNEKNKTKEKVKTKNNNTKKTEKEKKNINIKFFIKLFLFLMAFILLFGICYYFKGLIVAAIISFGALIFFLIGHALDKQRYSKKKKKALKIILIIILAIGIIGLLGVGAFLLYIVKNAPDFKEELLKEKESTVLYDSKGIEYAKLGLELRENIEYDQISESFIDALVATEDSRFFQHNGFDLMRFTKAAFGQVLGQGDAGGGSTLTMQVSKNTFTDTSSSGFKGIVRKFTDIYISIFQIERNYTKEQIIEFYVNNHSLSGTIYGVQEASLYFFNKDAKDLTISEAALLVGMYQAPSSYNPFNHPQAATKRRNTVLYLMHKHGYITEEERKLAASIPVESLLTDTSKEANEYQGYIDLVCKEVKEKYGVDPYSTPMLIYTNMVRSKQDGVNKILNGKTSFKWKDNDIQAGIAVLDSTSGKVIAIGAGRNRTGAKSYSYATDINRQIGSTAKPLFDYGPGMEYNNWSTYTLFVDEPYTYSNGKKISNFDSKYEGTVTLRRALSNSRNIPALKAFQQVDNKKIIDLVTSVGITPEISNGSIHEAHAIGAFTGSNPLTMAGAYQIFSNGGYFYQPYAVSKIVFRNTGEVVEYSSPKVKIISDSTAYMIADVLKGVADGTVMSGLKDKVACKTGTTNVDSATKKAKKLPSSIVRDYWIDGFTYNTVISIWLGYDELNSKHYLNYNHDGWIRKSLLNQVAKVVFDHNNVDFTRPKSVVSSKVEKMSDPPKLPSASTPSDQIVTELFRRGTEPTEISTKYLTLDTPANLTVTNHKTYVTLNWSGVANLEYVEDGIMGYYIYFEDKKLYFTEGTTFTINNLDSYYGKYSVRAGYKDTESALSSATSYTLKEDVYKLSLNGQSNVTYYVGEKIDSSLYNGNILSLTCNDVNVINASHIDITIVNSQGVKVSTISNDKADTYTINYEVTYDSYTGKTSNKITIKEKEVPHEDPPEEPVKPVDPPVDPVEPEV